MTLGDDPRNILEPQPLGWSGLAMSVSRRKFLLVSSLGLMAAGCAQQRASYGDRPGPAWPGGAARPQAAPGYPPPAPRPAATTPAPAPSAAANPLGALPRSRWTRSVPVTSKLNPMSGVQRITVHHEGWHAVWFTDAATTAARIEQDRATHVRDRGWADLGYHFVIDRAGRLWEGRSVAYQGAHVKANNEHNLGIMVLGNFDVQTPSDAQVATVQRTVSALMRQYRVPVSRVFTHQELMPTACPGRNFQPRMVALRRGGYLA
jgi:hypothetical protein